MPPNGSSAFSDIQTFSELDAHRKNEVLESLGELAAETGLSAEKSTFGFFDRAARPYDFGAHTFGYIRPAEPDEAHVEIVHAGNIQPDVALKDASIWIGLGGLRVASYPGRGKRTILFDFYARNQIKKESENLHYNAKYTVADNDHAGVLNLPIFVDLSVGETGVAFECVTVNVSNHDDEAFLSFLEGDAFKSGLKLAKTLQPAIAVFSETALSITRSIAKRNRNVPVQKFALGLDFSDRTAAGARLREGTYVAVQIPQQDTRIWSWPDWVWSCSDGLIVDAATRSKLLPFNAVTINVRAAA